jgi:hypothetical protein
VPALVLPEAPALPLVPPFVAPPPPVVSPPLELSSELHAANRPATTMIAPSDPTLNRKEFRIDITFHWTHTAPTDPACELPQSNASH